MEDTHYGRIERYLDTFVNYEVLPGFGFAEAGYSLSHLEELLRRLDGPHVGPRTVHVAGSKGKGSVCAMVASALSACGLRTGLYTSPHLLHLGERIQVDGVCATPDDLLAAMDAMRPHVEAMRAEGTWRAFTYFELLTVMAFLHFRARGVQAQVVEVGLGGRLDATNVVRPDVCVLAPISLEHTAVLGDTVGKIAREKAGIVKRGIPVVCAPQPSEAMRAIESICGEREATLTRVGEEVTWQVIGRSLDGQTLRTEGVGGPMEFVIPLIATYEAENAAVAVAALQALRSRGVSLESGCVVTGLGRTRWPGRFQVLAREPLLVLDGAHNPASMKRLAEDVDLVRGGGCVVYVLGFSSDKDVIHSVAELSRTGGRLVLTRSSQPRALEPGVVAERISGLGIQCVCEPQPLPALLRARGMVDSSGMVVVAGSLYLVAEVLRGWDRDNALLRRWAGAPRAVPRSPGGE